MHGMFALEIWNRRARRLILARNRIGKKPLYYAATADTFLFGSEIKALLTWPGPPRATDLSAIDRYVTWGYMPTLYTAFKGIRKLAAAHYLRRGAYRRLHGVGVRPLLASPPRGGTAIIELRCELAEQLENPMRLRMASDVPLGAFLSGGVDSFAVVAMMARIGGGTVKTFSKRVFGKKYNETRYARMVAQRYAIEHQKLVAEPDAVAVLLGSTPAQGPQIRAFEEHPCRRYPLRS